MPAADTPGATRRPVTGTAAPALDSPASSGGSTGSNETARRGSPPSLSSQRPSQPVLPGRSGFGGLPDVHGPEVAAVGLWVAHAADDGEPLVAVELVQTLQRRVEPGRVVQTQHLVGRVGQAGPRVVIGRVGVRDDGGEAVVAAVESDQHEGTVARCPARVRRPWRGCPAA